MLKVMTILGTRPDLIKMSRVIAKFDMQANHLLVHTGQNYDYELNEIFFQDLEIRKPDYFLSATGPTAASSIARVIEKSDEVLRQEMPDAVLLYGDTNSCMSVIAAKRLKIPVFHMEAGNRCFDQRVPEELNRKVLDHLSDINIVLTEHARRYLIGEGISQDTIIKSGSHMPEVLGHYQQKIQQSLVLSTLGLRPKHFFLVSAHREENVDNTENLSSLLGALNALASRYQVPIIFSTHPRTAKRLESLDVGSLDNLVRFVKPFSFSDYIKLQKEALCTLSDSGTVTEEASILGFPAITIRNMHERPEGMDAGTLIMSGLREDNIMDAVDVTIECHKRSPKKSFEVPDYKMMNVSDNILKIVYSYTDYVNRNVWKK